MLTFRQLGNDDDDFLVQNNIREPKTKWSLEVQKPLETQLSFLLKELTCLSSGEGSLISSCMENRMHRGSPPAGVVQDAFPPNLLAGGQSRSCLTTKEV